MDVKMVMFLIICYILCCIKVEAILLISGEEDLELEKQLRNINKSSLATITTDYGDTYDCVDFYKQPAFDHPLLKNHTFHSQMDYKHPKSNNSSSFNGHLFKVFKQGCPVGSVPIKRTTKADLMREKKYFLNLGSKKTGTDYALVHTGIGPFNGGSMIAGVYKPAASGQQYSAVRMKMQSGDDAIQIGWRVDPSLYGDDQVRFYTYFKSGERQCFNTKCPGFVLVNKDYPIDYVFKRYFKPGDKNSVEVKLHLARDPANGNWWVEVGGRIRLGFWPGRLFSSLNGLAAYVDWGGEVYNTIDKEEVDMGLGMLAIKDTDKTAYCRVIEVSTPDGRTRDATKTIVYESDIQHYRVLDLEHADNYYRHAVLYGGPYRNF